MFRRAWSEISIDPGLAGTIAVVAVIAVMTWVLLPSHFLLP
jgi:hypothetical protein